VRALGLPFARPSFFPDEVKMRRTRQLLTAVLFGLGYAPIGALAGSLSQFADPLLSAAALAACGILSGLLWDKCGG
jgi:hypothetical protein